MEFDNGEVVFPPTPDPVFTASSSKIAVAADISLAD